MQYFLFAVGEPPAILEPLSDQVVVSPDDAILECYIDPGDPPAEIHWYKDNKEVYKSKKYTISFKDEVAELVISGTDIKDSGWYRCEAVNKLGRVETQCTLAVESKCFTDI